MLALKEAKAEWIFGGRNSLQVNFFQPIFLVGENQVAEDTREVFSAFKNSIEIHKKKEMLYECETKLIFVHIQRYKRKGQCYKLCRGVGECVFW